MWWLIESLVTWYYHGAWSGEETPNSKATFTPQQHRSYSHFPINAVKQWPEKGVDVTATFLTKNVVILMHICLKSWLDPRLQIHLTGHSDLSLRSATTKIYQIDLRGQVWGSSPTVSLRYCVHKNGMKGQPENLTPPATAVVRAEDENNPEIGSTRREIHHNIT